jgi:WD40 repeat protein
MDDQITCVTYSPDQRLVAVALLDNTVKIFFNDTLKVRHKVALKYNTVKPVNSNPAK